MGHQKYRYLKRKGSTYYFSRRVPKALQSFVITNRIEICLHTQSEASALRQSIALSADLEDRWAILRRQQRASRIERLFRSQATGWERQVKGQGPLLSAALNTYLDLKGRDRSPTFEAGARRSITYLLEVSEDKPLDTYCRVDANAYREHLRGKGQAPESISRNLNNVRAIVNFVLREAGLPASTAFTSVYLGDKTTRNKRYVPTASELQTLKELCINVNDEPRWLIALAQDTGLRLSEALGLTTSDVVLDAAEPHIIVQPHPWRRLKTDSSTRVVPLVGCSLWAAECALEATTSTFMFPRYCKATGVRSNSASATVNKWLKTNINELLVVHSLRHAFRDRLRATGASTELSNALGGWTNYGVGERYGNGFGLKVRYEALNRIAS